MTSFLIVYDRKTGSLIDLQTFGTGQRTEAEAARRRAEMQYPNREVVLLQADDEAALRHTHGRYFQDLEDLLRRLNDGERVSPKRR